MAMFVAAVCSGRVLKRFGTTLTSVLESVAYADDPELLDSMQGKSQKRVGTSYEIKLDITPKTLKSI